MDAQVKLFFKIINISSNIFIKKGLLYHENNIPIEENNNQNN